MNTVYFGMQLVYWFGFLVLWTLGTLELNLKFGKFIFHKLSSPSPPYQVVNGE